VDWVPDCELTGLRSEIVLIGHPVTADTDFQQAMWL